MRHRLFLFPEKNFTIREKRKKQENGLTAKLKNSKNEKTYIVIEKNGQEKD